MKHLSRAYRTRKLLGKLLRFLLISILVCVLGYLFLFRINRFTLTAEPLGPAEVSVQPLSEYQDAGITILLKGSLVFRSGIPVPAEISIQGNVDTAISGDHTIQYHAVYHNWEARTSRIVHVVDRDDPVITLHSIPGAFTIPGEPYQEEGFQAYDELDGDLTGSVRVREENGYVYYWVSDHAGNETRISRKIRYVDPVPPVITLLGGSEVRIPAGEPFQDPGWTVMDNSDGDLSGEMHREGTIDHYLAGAYELFYTVTDSSGNTAEARRAVIVEGAPVRETIIPGKKVVYLTFDDGPGPYTAWLLDILKKYNAKATFFVVNTDYLYLCQRMVDEGHAVGIHSVTHNYRQIYASPEAFFQDLLQMQDLIYQNSGIKTYLMRFPGGSSNTVSRICPGIMTYLTQAVEDCGFRYFDWNVDSLDAGGATKSKEVSDSVISGIRRTNGAVVLQHDIKDFSVAAVERILAWGTANGYQFLAMDMTSPTAHHGVNN